MFRREAADPEKAYTLIRLGDAQFRLPPGWRGRNNEGPARVRAYDGTSAALQAEIARRLAAAGGNPDVVNCEINAPAPRGGRVPHGDVIAVLDAFLEAGLTDVKFEGAATPLTGAERAERAAGR